MWDGFLSLALRSLYIVTQLLEILTVICNQSCFGSKFLSDQIAFFKAVIQKNTVFAVLKNIYVDTNECCI